MGSQSLINFVEEREIIKFFGVVSMILVIVDAISIIRDQIAL